MPKYDGSPTRAEISLLNKAAHALAQVEAHEWESTIPDVIVDRDEDHLPEGLINGQTMRRGRGDLTDEACVNRICMLVAHGVTESRACDYLGLSATDWGDWKRYNHHNITTKLLFAKGLFLDRKADEVFDIIDNPNILKMPARDENGNLTEASIDMKMRWAEARVRVRQWALEKLSPAHAPKSNTNVNIYAEIKAAKTPQEAMQRYIQLIDARVDK